MYIYIYMPNRERTRGDGRDLQGTGFGWQHYATVATSQAGKKPCVATTDRSPPFISLHRAGFSSFSPSQLLLDAGINSPIESCSGSKSRVPRAAGGGHLRTHLPELGRVWIHQAHVHPRR